MLRTLTVSRKCFVTDCDVIELICPYVSPYYTLLWNIATTCNIRFVGRVFFYLSDTYSGSKIESIAVDIISKYWPLEIDANCVRFPSLMVTKFSLSCNTIWCTATVLALFSASQSMIPGMSYLLSKRWLMLPKFKNTHRNTHCESMDMSYELSVDW